MTKVDEILTGLQTLAPEVAKQMCESALISCYFGIVFAFIILIIGILLAICGKKENEEGILGFGVAIVIIALLASSMISFRVYQIKHYPLAYLAEKLTSHR